MAALGTAKRRTTDDVVAPSAPFRLPRHRFRRLAQRAAPPVTRLVPHPHPFVLKELAAGRPNMAARA